VYNYFLKEKQEHYTKTKKTLNYYTCAGNLVKLKRNEFHWLKEVNSQSLQVSLKNLESAYGNFFHKRSRFPNFKSKKSKNSFTIPQHIKIIDSKIYFFKFSEGINIKSSGLDDYRHGAEISPKSTSVNLGTSVEMSKKKCISTEA